jgi:hypothetical protein
MTVKQKKVGEQEFRPFSEPERFLDDAVERVRENAGHLRKDAVSFVKREPEKALLSALALGYVLRTLPLLPILGLLTRVAVGVFKLVALSYLVTKVIGSSQRGSGKGDDE